MLALYTTVYPAAERFFSSWIRSVMEQKDRDFDLWLGVDSIPVNRIKNAVRCDLNTRFVVAGPGDTPASLRERALLELCSLHNGVVLVDSDDILMPTRVEAARKGLESCDLYGCALKIIDENGADLETRFGPSDGVVAEELLPSVNVFGFTNTAWRTAALRQLFPLPANCTLVDWLLATKAWVTGLRICFDAMPRMLYRQYAGNIARVLPPFSREQVLHAAEMAASHFRMVLRSAEGFDLERLDKLKNAAYRADKFYRVVTGSSKTLFAYTERLNNLPPPLVWWGCVAHPQLEEIWNI